MTKAMQFIVTVEVAENVAELYPNYGINYDTPEEFAEALVSRFDPDHSTTDTFKEWGFRYKYQPTAALCEHICVHCEEAID
tara:strand:- start:3698 stop:3940 length:243 start_codon:yes stop_codon:yes gene_type:complete